ncbi:MAG: hypothetical protein L6R41_006059 [Letrouitia leprolyta]|nr:MAG: hypothetical protein L6R41_006059 [Letrouitia leprolyta]
MSGSNSIEATLPSTLTQATPSPESFRSAEASAKEWNSEHHYHSTEPTINHSTQPYDVEEDHGRRTQRARRSGGFLLQNATPAYTSNTRLRPLQRMDDSKGKAGISKDDSMNTKQAPTRRHHQKTSIGSSPLSTVVSNDVDRPRSYCNQSRKFDRTFLNNSDTVAQEQGKHDESLVNSQTLSSEGQYSDTRMPSAIGHDTDPAQIVNLALNLSESRRRNISGTRLSPVYINGTQRQISTGSSSPGLPSRHFSTAGMNLRRHLNDQRRISRTSASRSGADSWESPSPRSTQSSNRGILSFSSDIQNLSTAEEVILKPSEATLARAERARISFELSYEYRRLLQYLPKLPNTARNKHISSKSANDSEMVALNALGRAYDPLQYIRNRKVRGRERQHFDAEAEGWKDVYRVRLWVDRLADTYEIGSPLETADRLPPLGSIQTDVQTASASPQSNGLMNTATRPSKSERQSSDWAFTPWDLLADAAWLDRDSNIGLIEDSKGKKQFPSQKIPSQATPRTSLEQNRSPSKRSLSLSRPMVTEEQRSEGAPSTKQRKRNLSHIRGKSNEVRSPLKDTESPKERRGRWHRTFIRSRSPSSSEGSLTDGTSGYAWHKHHDREGLDSVALEKQMMELLAKEIDDDPFFSKPGETEPIKEFPRKRSLDDEREKPDAVSRSETAQKSAQDSKTDIASPSD